MIKTLTVFSLFILIYLSPALNASCPPGWNEKRHVVKGSGSVCYGACKPAGAELRAEAPDKVICRYTINCPRGYVVEEWEGKYTCVMRMKPCSSDELTIVKKNRLCCRIPYKCPEGYSMVGGKKCSEQYCQRCIKCHKGETLGRDNSCRLVIDGCKKGYKKSLFPGGIGCMKILYQCGSDEKLKLLPNGKGFECVDINKDQ